MWHLTCLTHATSQELDPYSPQKQPQQASPDAKAPQGDGQAVTGVAGAALATGQGCWGGFRSVCQSISQSVWFEFLNMIIIILNAIALGLNWWVPHHVMQCSMCVPACRSPGRPASLPPFKPMLHALPKAPHNTSFCACSMYCSCRYNMPPKLDTSTTLLNYIFTLYFVVEVLIRLSGMGFEAYFSDSTNW